MSEQFIDISPFQAETIECCNMLFYMIFVHENLDIDLAYCQIIFTVCQPYAVLLTLNLASIALAFWLIAERTRISPVTKSYLRSVLFTGGVKGDDCSRY